MFRKRAPLRAKLKSRIRQTAGPRGWLNPAKIFARQIFTKPLAAAKVRAVMERRPMRDAS
jgi:hypothetical protein